MGIELQSDETQKESQKSIKTRGRKICRKWGLQGFSNVVKGRPISQLPDKIFKIRLQFQGAEEKACLLRNWKSLVEPHLLGFTTMGFIEAIYGRKMSQKLKFWAHLHISHMKI